MSNWQKNFEAALKDLNPQQLKAVKTIEGPVMVLAGPGTGKTQVVALRIANILQKTQIGPQNILALTFTDAGVTALRERLTKITGPVGYQVTVATFHSFAAEVIGIFPHLFTHTETFRQVNDAERFLLIEEILNTNTKLKLLRPLRRPDYYVREIGQRIKTAKQENVTPDQLAKLLKKTAEKSSTDQLARLREFAVVYKDYDLALRQKGWYDYEDTIQFVLEALRDNLEVKAYFQERYQYLLVDEYQDTNNSQNALVEALADFYQNPNLFVVGDDKQAIYRFQGASVANMLHFKNRYPDMVIITLTANYRSTPEILDVADKLISHNQTQIGAVFSDGPPSLKSVRQSGVPVTLAVANSPLAQFQFILDEVVQTEKAGTPLSAMAVLWRKREDVAEFVAFAQKSGLAVSGQVLTELFNEPAVASLVKLLGAIADPTDNIALISALKPTLEPKDLVELYKTNRASRSGTAMVEKLLKAVPGLRQATEKILEASRLAEGLSIQELLEWLIGNTRFINSRLEGKGALAQAQILLAFHAQAKNFSLPAEGNTLGEFLGYCRMVRERNLEVPVVKLLPSEGLFVGTVHSAKGLEFKRVFLAGADEKRWRLKAKPELIKLPGEIVGLAGWEDNLAEDERRLFYVGATRAIDELTVTYSATDEDDRTILPAQFVSELGALPQTKITLTGPAMAAAAKKLLSPLTSAYLSAEELAYARAVIKNSPFSYSDLRSYQTCPRQYYLSRVLRLPQPPSESLIYGNVVHKALEQFFREFRGFKKRPSRERLLELTEEAAEQLAPPQWRERIMEHALTVLDAYYLAKAPTWQIPAGVEYSFTHHQVRYGDIWLTGKIDRIDTISDGNFRVVDYKTKSRSPSRNEIEGKTKNSDGAIKDQLVFYALLAKHDPLFPHRLKELQVSIIDDKLEFRDEILAVDNNEIRAMEKRLETVATEIFALEEFAHQRPDFDKGCEICQLYN